MTLPRMKYKKTLYVNVYSLTFCSAARTALCIHRVHLPTLLKGLQHNGEFAKKIANNVTGKIALRICDSCFTLNCGSSMINKIANRAYKARTDWLNHFNSPWESEGYKVESQNDPTTSDLKPYLSQFGSSHHRRARNNQIHENQRIKGEYKMKSG